MAKQKQNSELGKQTKQQSIDGELFCTETGEWRGRCLVKDCFEPAFISPEALEDHLRNEHCITRKLRIRGSLGYERFLHEQDQSARAPTIEDIQRDRQLRQVAMDLLEDPDWLDQLWQRMDQHIKYDWDNRRLLFKIMASAFALEKPMNATMRASSSTGKTYLATQVGRYFPKNHIEYLEGATPKSIYYDYGEWDEENKIRILDLRGKIWVFLDIPEQDTLRFIKAMMSHDANERTYKTVIDQKQVKIILRGYACVIACTTSPKYNEEMSTRALVITPEQSEEKIEAAIQLFYKQCANPQFTIETDDLQTALLLLSETKRTPRFPDASKYGDHKIQEIKSHRKLRPRDMRDLKWLPRLALVTAWLNQRQRITDDEFIDVSEEDWIAAEADWAPIHETTTSGLTAEQITFLKAMQMDTDYTARDLQALDHETTGRYRSYDTLKRKLLDPLQFANYIDWETDPLDKRRYLFRKISAMISKTAQNGANFECEEIVIANRESSDLSQSHNHRIKTEQESDKIAEETEHHKGEECE